MDKALPLRLLILLLFFVFEAAAQPSPQERLISAIYAGNLSEIKSALGEGADPNKINTQGISPLLAALSSGRGEAASLLIEKGADPKAKNHLGMGYLFNLLYLNKPDMVELLLEQDVDVGTPMAGGYTYLMYAAQGAGTEEVALLLKYGADPEAKNMAGQTAVHVAASQGKLENLKVLHEQGAALDAKDMMGQTAMHLAAQAGKGDLIEWLHGHGLSVHDKNMGGETPLTLAAQAQSFEACEALIRLGADPKAPNLSGQTPAQIAGWYKNQALVDYLNNPVAQAGKADVAKLNKELVQLIQNGGWSTYVSEEVFAERMKKVEVLLDKGAEAEHIDQGGYTPLLWAVQSNWNPSFIQMLIDRGANPKARNLSKETALHLNAGNANIEVGELLLQKGLSVDARNNGGITPLMIAAEDGSLEYCQWIYGKGADASIKDENGKSAIAYAEDAGELTVAFFLKNPGEFKDDILWRVQNVYKQPEEPIDWKSNLEALERKASASGSAKDWKELAESYWWTGDYAKSVEAAQRAVEASEGKAVYPEMLEHLGHLYWKQGKREKADEAFGKAWAWAQANLSEGEAAYAKSRVLMQAWGLFNQDKALDPKLLEESLSKLGTVGYEAQGSDIAYELAASYYFATGGYMKANQAILSAYQINIERYGTQSPRTVKLWQNLGDLWKSAGYWDMAVEYYEKALGETSNKLGASHPLYFNALRELGSIYAFWGNYSNAELLLQQASDRYLAAFGGNHPEYALCLGAQANLYRRLGNFRAAKWLITEALSIYEKKGLRGAAYATLLYEAAEAYRLSGELDRSEELFKKSSRIAQEWQGLQAVTYLSATNQLAWQYIRSRTEDKYLQAEQLLQNSLQASEKMRINAAKSGFPTLGSVYELRTLYYLAMLHHERLEWEKASYYYDKAIAMAYAVNQSRVNEEQAAIFFDQGRLNVARKKWGEAERQIKKGIESVNHSIRYAFPTMSEYEKQQFYQTLKEDINFFNYFILQRYAESPQLLGDMYDQQLSTKALILTATQSILEVVNSGNSPALKAKYEQWKSLRDQMARDQLQGKSVDELERRANALEKEIALEASGWKAPPPPPNWLQLRDKLKPSEVAVEMVRVQHGAQIWYAALVIHAKSKNPELVLLANGSEMEGAFLKFYRAAIKYKIEDTKSYDAYWKPIWEGIKRLVPAVKKIYFSPDGVYHQVSPNTLKNPATSEFLIDEVQIQQLTRTDDLLSFGGPASTDRNRALLVGNPAYGLRESEHIEAVRRNRSSAAAEEQSRRAAVAKTAALKETAFAPLPGTAEEVRVIDSLLHKGSWETELLTESNALEERIKGFEKPHLLHIATHGFFLPSDEASISEADTAGLRVFTPLPLKEVYEEGGLDALLQSGVVLAGVNSRADTLDSGIEDGILTAYEVVGLDLSGASLVVLSACETGLGEVRVGEGVYGLQRSLKVAGAAAIAMSLWSVDDRATQMLMTEFYRGWLSSGNKQESFRKAQMKVREAYPHPFYWGAFILLGE